MSTSTTTSAVPRTAPVRPVDPGTGRRGRTGRVVAGSLATGLLAAVLLVAAPLIPATEAGVTGAVLCGWALGWALLALLSRRTDQPQPWAAVPALHMGLSGSLLVTFGSPVLEVLTWVWPPTLFGLVVWMGRRARRTLRSPARRWLLHPVLAVLALASLGGGVQTVLEAADARAAMPGQLVDVGGHRLHLHCTGSGGPTVVLEPGAGAMSSSLDLITPAVAADARVCVYDRAGRGWSDAADPPQDARQIATDLHTALHRARVPGPYVLAGHSFGGRYALTFAARYPDEVVGMVLVDCTAPAAAPTRRRSPSELTDRLSALVSTTARLGLTRPLGVPDADHLRSTIEEYLQGEASAAQAAELRDLADEPLVVLTAGRGSAAGWSAEQDALARLSTGSVSRVVQDVDHAGLVADEQGAAATARAVLDVVHSVRTHTAGCADGDPAWRRRPSPGRRLGRGVQPGRAPGRPALAPRQRRAGSSLSRVRTVSSREVHRNAWMSVREDEVVLPDGSPGRYGVVDKPDFALVVPREPDGSLWLVEQYRYPVGRRGWEFPQGSWGRDASGSQVELAAAELREETGLRAGALHHLGHLYEAPGFCSQGFDVYLAEDLQAGPVERETTEQDMRSQRVSDDAFRRMVRDGEVVDGASVAAYGLLLLHDATPLR